MQLQVIPWVSILALRSHIRQLLYIALYPPLPLPAASDERKEAGKDTFEPPTPSKLAAKQIQKSPLIPSAKATEAALRLLVSFAITNSPRALGRVGRQLARV